MQSKNFLLLLYIKKLWIANGCDNKVAMGVKEIDIDNISYIAFL